jgi:glutamyl-tRNA synthetase
LSAGVRFAPSPTGRFHLGNLRTAWISSTLARAQKQDWIVRVEDIDTQRSSAEAWDVQQADLKRLGLIPDEIVVQSDRLAFHKEQFEKARDEGRVYACDCSRKDVLESVANIERAPHEPIPEYSGHCRNRPVTDIFDPTETLAWRWRGVDESGRHDAIVARTDAKLENFVPGYHWACAIDDAHGNYAVLVRAWDLAPVEKTHSEIRQYVLGPTAREFPRVFHTSLVVREDGGRLEKRTQGVTLDEVTVNGWSVTNLLDSFAKSFDLNSALKSLNENNAVGEMSHEISVNLFLPR